MDEQVSERTVSGAERLRRRSATVWHTSWAEERRDDRRERWTGELGRMGTVAGDCVCRPVSVCWARASADPAQVPEHVGSARLFVTSSPDHPIT